MYDLIIIGGGPAGLTAAIYAARRAVKTLVLAKEFGGQAVYASKVENFPGFDMIAGYELMEKMKAQAEHLGAEVKNAEANEIKKENDIFFIRDKDGNSHEGKSLILSFGAVPRKLGLPNEDKFKGNGISYCATCDAPFYRNKNVAVVGGGNAALDAALLLAKFAKQVYLIHRRDEFKGEVVRVNEVKKLSNIEIILNSEVKEIKGEKNITGVAVGKVDGGETQDLEVNGIFVEIGHIVESDFVSKMVALDEQKQIIVNNKNETNVAGVFAAGDATTVPYKQIVIAAGEGAKAALSAYSYLQKVRS
ncbi:thioredoxin-disulfide reductase [Candidatus Falkowbacteria bacterium]|nr:thioredoxin-disulfide reductase [Candidatus Falkowbacteria bacterium]